MFTADAHCDTFTELYLNNRKQYDFSPQAMDIQDIHFQLAAIFTDTSINNSLDSYSDFIRYYEFAVNYISRLNKFRLCKANEDIKKCIEAHINPIALTVENGAVIGNDISRISQLKSMGIRAITLVWNNRNNLGCGAGWQQYSDIDTGLTPFGIKCIREMEKFGIIPDGAHLSERGFYQLAQTVHQPIFVSHTACKKICKHERNLSDEQLTEVGKTGGYVGIVMYPVFLSAHTESVNDETVLMHIEHATEVCGVECIGFGSDMDGFDLKYNEYRGFSTFYRIINLLLRKNYSEDNVKKIAGLNLLNKFLLPPQ